MQTWGRPHSAVWFLVLTVVAAELTSVHSHSGSSHPSSAVVQQGNGGNTQETRELSKHQSTTSEKQEASLLKAPHDHSPTACLALKGCACVANASGVDCPRRLEATCPHYGDLCCNMTIPDIPNCFSLNGTCLFNRSMVKCPRKLEAYCSDVSDYCCNMTLPPLPLCTKINGTCLSKNSHIHCPAHIDGYCSREDEFCCNLTSPPPPRPTCADVNGACIGDLWPFFCLTRADASCPYPGYYCCKSGGLSQTNGNDITRGGYIDKTKSDLRSKMPACSDFNASCIPDTPPYYCPPLRILNAMCPFSFRFIFVCCGTNNSASIYKLERSSLTNGKDTTGDDFTDNAKTMPVCSDFDASCIGDTWPYYCPPMMRLNATCPQMFYCCGTNDSASVDTPDVIELNNEVTALPTCYDQQGHCFPSKFETACSNSSRLNASCPELNHYCCSMTILSVSQVVSPNCSQINGTCLHNASAIHCPSVLDAKCSDPGHYCCNMTIQHFITYNSKRDLPQVKLSTRKIGQEERSPDAYTSNKYMAEVEEIITTEKQSLQTLHNSLLIKKHFYPLPKRTNKEQPAVKTLVKKTYTENVSEIALPTCESLDGGKCLYNNSRIFCTKKLNAECRAHNFYCCKLN